MTGSDTPETARVGVETDEVRALDVLRRGLAVSDDLRRGLGVTAAVAVFAAVGRLIVPILVQLVLDHGVLGAEGYRPGLVWVLSLSASQRCWLWRLRAARPTSGWCEWLSRRCSG